MFYYEFEDDERRALEAQRETPFSFGVEDCEGEEAARRLHEAAEEASTWLALRGVGGVRSDGVRGRVWIDREESGKAFIYLMDRYTVRRHAGHNLVEIG
jgi:hypothetical protein